MKKLLSVFLILAVIASCKKDDDENHCEKSVAGIANNFKLTKITTEVGGQSTDVALTGCEQTGVYSLKSDKSATYAETGGGCDTDVQTGTWDVVNNQITITVGSYSVDELEIYSWDCSSLVAGYSQDLGAAITTTKYTFVKQ